MKKEHEIAADDWIDTNIDEEIMISCNGKERKGMSTMTMDMNKYIDGVK